MGEDRRVYPIPVSTSDVGGPEGHSYGAVILPADALPTDALTEALTGMRFSGWIAPPRDGYVVVLGATGGGVVADGRRGVIEVGETLAGQCAGPVLAVRVLSDRQLALVAWSSGDEIARYCSDPSREPGAEDDVLAEPFGAECAESLAELWRRPEVAEDLSELLTDELDPDSVYESERLGRVLRLLGLPAWLVASGSLPRAMPTGPRVSELSRMRAGLTGMGGLSREALLRPVRRRQTPPPVIADPPMGGGAGFEAWMF